MDEDAGVSVLRSHADVPNYERRRGIGYVDRPRGASVDVPSFDDVRIAGGAGPARDSVRGGELRVAYDRDGPMRAQGARRRRGQLKRREESPDNQHSNHEPRG